MSRGRDCWVIEEVEDMVETLGGWVGVVGCMEGGA